MVTASEALIVYEALQIAKAGGVSYKAALDLMKKTKSQHGHRPPWRPQARAP